MVRIRIGKDARTRKQILLLPVVPLVLVRLKQLPTLNAPQRVNVPKLHPLGSSRPPLRPILLLTGQRRPFRQVWDGKRTHPIFVMVSPLLLVPRLFPPL